MVTLVTPAASVVVMACTGAPGPFGHWEVGGLGAPSLPLILNGFEFGIWSLTAPGPLSVKPPGNDGNGIRAISYCVMRRAPRVVTDMEVTRYTEKRFEFSELHGS